MLRKWASQGLFLSMPKHINPAYRRQTAKTYSLAECQRLIKSDTQVLSQLISRAESTLAADKKFLKSVYKVLHRKKDVKRIAITGAPGVGKSSFLNAYCKHLIDSGYRVAILPVDPSSYTTRGSILGDKTRMDALVGIEGVFIKPMASALALGGVAPATSAAICLCEMADYDYIFIETVGVGQSEYEVRDLVDLFILLLQPGGGDELQGIKRGIMEMADLLLITKADGELKSVAQLSRDNYRSALSLFSINEWSWKPRCALFSSMTTEYLSGLDQQIEAYYAHMEKGNRLAQFRMHQEQLRFKEGQKNLLYRRLAEKKSIKERIETLSLSISSGELSHLQALNSLEELLENIDAYIP